LSTDAFLFSNIGFCFSAFVGFAFLGDYKPLDKPVDDKPAKCKTAFDC